MLQTITGTAAELGSRVETALASYRYKIFLEKLGWPLPSKNGEEVDEFDRTDTVYVIAKDQCGEICGCARLLPTTRPYLLREIFPELMGDIPLPNSADTWELSRFSATPLNEPSSNTAQAWKNTCTLVAETVSAAIQLGASRLIAFSAVGNERLLRRMGVSVHRVSAPQLIDSKPVLAFWIEIDEQTKTALNITSRSSAPLFKTNS
ncbi:N-acylhomoserine lactone synthase [Pseudomonas gingeri]|uniref:acyl-homoserine-lactone synthase n=1 Tax=Pseudomonas gingeri TaxID=117681 RepID=UPI0015A41EFF|nr:acyl-homoserine-lactone synthase [Pseudomonas gingeri]NWA29714.1 N-acylhomoserine lactone synthase [Pseudomonas gingeri]NWD71146.1 N-acylhomoserine lactone synthase [Pseudomonas gingeri]